MNECLNFRFFDEETQKYTYYSGVWGHTRPYTENSTFSQYESCPRYHNGVVERCLGLKDRNGKLIFEGDRLQKLKLQFLYPTGDEEDAAQLETIREHYKIIEERPDEANWIRVVYLSSQTDIATMSRFPGFWLQNEEFGYEGECLEEPENWVIIGTIHDKEDRDEQNR